MKAVQINAYGDNDVIEINTVPISNLLEGQLLIEMRAAGINPVDWKIRAGYLQQLRPLPFPLTLGMDFSGVVVAVGKGVSDFKLGDEVYGMSNFFSGGTGSFAEFIAVDAGVVNHKPKTLSHSESAALPMAGVSALQVLVDVMQLSKDQKILIHGGAGGIGTFAIQIAKHLGATVATTISVAGMQMAQDLGADIIIDYKNQSFENLLQDYDAVLDTIGGETYRKSFAILKRDGVIVSLLEQPDATLMQQYNVMAMLEFTAVTRARLATLAQLVDQQIIKVNLAKTFTLEQITTALEYLQNGHPQGKVVVVAKNDNSSL